MVDEHQRIHIYMYLGAVTPKSLNTYQYISTFMRKITMQDKKFQLTEEIDLVYEKTITKYGTGAKIDAPKEFLGRKVYVLIRKQ